jgi:4-amino-4-deoxy-L-arabinose transferase-like glycosyltransferase
MESIKKIIKNNKFLLLILLLGGILRFYQLPAYVEYLGDQGRDLLHVRDLLVNQDLMFIGPRTSVGDMYLGPWYYYVMAPFLLLANFSPLGPVVMVILFSLATAYLLYRTGKEWFNQQAGLIAAFLGAVSPVLVKFSTFSWNPNILPFFSLLSIWLTYRIWQKKEYNKLIWLAVSLALVLNSHYLGLLLFPVIAIFLLITLKRDLKTSKKTQLIKKSLIAIGLFSVLMSPLLIFDLKHNWQNVKSFQSFFSQGNSSQNFELLQGLADVPVVLNQVASQLLLNQDKGIPVLISLLTVGLILFLGRNKQPIQLLGATFLVGVLGLAVYQNDIYAHYLGFLYPILTLMIAYLLSKLKLFGWIMALVIISLMFANWHGWSQPNYQLKRTREIADLIIDQSSDQPFALALLAGNNYDDSYQYFLKKNRSKLVDLHQTSADQLFVVCEYDHKKECQPLGHPKWEIAVFGQAVLDQQWEVQGVNVYQLTRKND